MAKKNEEEGQLGTPERMNKAPTRKELTNEGKRVYRVLIQNPLDYYLRRSKGGINYRQWEAGDKLNRDFVAGSFLPSPVPVLTEVFIPSQGRARDYSPSQYDAQERFRKAIGTLGAPSRPGVLVVLNVCCYGYFLKDISLPYYSDASKMFRLCEALDDLADYYGIPYYPTPSKRDRKNQDISTEE